MDPLGGIVAESKIIEKIRKLLELADETRGGTEAERELAAKRAQELMLKHNLESADLIGQSAPGDVQDGVERIEGSMAEWQVSLILGIGDACFVSGFYTQRARFTWDVTTIGRPDNVAFVKTLCSHLVPWLEQEAKDAFKIAQEEDETVKSRSFRRAFYASATRIITMRLHALRKETMGGTGMELARNERAVNEQHLKDMEIELRASRKRSYGSDAGHEAGRDAGARADLTPGRKLNS